jgi:hypothetical protein
MTGAGQGQQILVNNERTAFDDRGPTREWYRCELDVGGRICCDAALAVCNKRTREGEQKNKEDVLVLSLADFSSPGKWRGRRDALMAG